MTQIDLNSFQNKIDNGENIYPEFCYFDEQPSELTFSAADFYLTLSAWAEHAAHSKTRFQIATLWLTKYSAQRSHGGLGLVTAIANDLGYSTRTVQKHIQAIADDETLGNVFRYENRRKQA